MLDTLRIESISALHSILQQPPPKHPLITVIDLSKLKPFGSDAQTGGVKVISSFYAITLKHLKAGSLAYGRRQIDFQEGSLFFSYPDQVGVLENPVFDEHRYSWGLFFHADLVHGTPLAGKLSECSFFRYTVNEALHLSDDEQESLTAIVNSIRTELQRPIDKHTKDVYVSAIELLLNHCNRYYDRQFITRENRNKSVLELVNAFLNQRLKNVDSHEIGLPTALECAQHVNLSPNYLSDLLRKETGKTTQEHIHFWVLEEAKDRLLGSNQSVKEIAHSLGFEYPHYFSSLFKKKVGVSPSEFRNAN
ncbi:MAG: helix-turn-helix domain-containing protein [Flavobacteriales bacterium]